MATSHPHRSVLCLAGSLRRASWNRRLLHAATLVAPPGLTLSVFDALSSVPLFDEDAEQREPAGPAGVQALRTAIAAADGLIVATPEYNHAMPGVLKNALDWLSREGVRNINAVNEAIQSAVPWWDKLGIAAPA